MSLKCLLTCNIDLRNICDYEPYHRFCDSALSSSATELALSFLSPTGAILDRKLPDKCDARMRSIMYSSIVAGESSIECDKFLGSQNIYNPNFTSFMGL